MTTLLPKDAATLHAIAQELAGQDADYIEKFLHELVADLAKSGPATASPQSARRSARRNGPSRASGSPVL
jgi:uncharacterized protein (DUF2267 family)